MNRETHLHMLLLIYLRDFFTAAFEDVTHIPLTVKMIVTEQHLLFFPTGLEKTFLTKLG